jgi:hypothetical protein
VSTHPDAVHQAAVIAALGGSAQQAYAIGRVPATKPSSYNEVTVMRRFGGVTRGDADPGAKLYRVFVRSVGQLVDNAQAQRTRAAALENQVVTVAGETTTPLAFETAEPIGLDDGWYSGSLQLIYAL